MSKQEAACKQAKAESKQAAAKQTNGELNGNVLGAYFNDLKRIPMLSHEEENEVAIRAVNGDKAAADKLVRANLRFVVHVAKRYQGKGLPLSDLISEGNIGLLSAVEHFDPSRGFHFVSYAIWWIKQSIIRALNDKARLIRIPVHHAEEMRKLSASNEDAGLNFSIENTELASAVTKYAYFTQEPLSLDTSVSHDEDTAPLSEYVEATNYDLPEEYTLNKILREQLERAIDSLDDREAAVIKLRYGFDTNKPSSLHEIGQAFDITKERVRQIENKAMKRLRTRQRIKQLQTYVA
jgi:RNA polymerase primary sigma factor